MLTLPKGKQIVLETKIKHESNSKLIFIDSITIPLNNGIPVGLSETEILELKQYVSIVAQAWLKINKNRGK